ncbi:hypothetical protein PHYPSEUDO_007074 [Phytophthora pseudosyringae]|uniref:Uncharacterized protein n=1 Tax=Phytophthora pseudosyringae TaxID=221518 RepID=A0A8T1VHS7_9STRA|nr:hypothetical protein PHYPSEUDO_007074 [Phytophthora pseudosyringae]
MAAFATLLLLVAVATTGFAIRLWLTGRLLPLKDHSKKQDEMNAEDVEIVVQKPANDRRLKLALPDLSYVQIRSPVGPMKSSIRSALKELRSRQMVQNLCSRFESRMKVSCQAEDSTKGAMKKSAADTTQILQPTRARRRDAKDASVAPVLLASELAKDGEIAANARSINLNKFLRSYASNLDNAVSAERRVVLTTDVISAERSIVMSTDAEDDVEQPLLAETEETANAEEIAAPPSETFADSDESGMELELDLHTLHLEAEYSNQCDSPPNADSEEEVSVLVDATECEPLVDESFGESDEGNNNVGTKRTAPARLALAFTLADCDVSKQSVPESARSSDSKPETCSAPPAKVALARFKQQVPSNGRRARSIATLSI